MNQLIPEYNNNSPVLQTETSQKGFLYNDYFSGDENTLMDFYHQHYPIFKKLLDFSKKHSTKIVVRTYLNGGPIKSENGGFALFSSAFSAVVIDMMGNVSDFSDNKIDIGNLLDNLSIEDVKRKTQNDVFHDVFEVNVAPFDNTFQFPKKPLNDVEWLTPVFLSPRESDTTL